MNHQRALVAQGQGVDAGFPAIEHADVAFVAAHVTLGQGRIGIPAQVEDAERTVGVQVEAGPIRVDDAAAVVAVDGCGGNAQIGNRRVALGQGRSRQQDKQEEGQGQHRGHSRGSAPQNMGAI